MSWDDAFSTTNCPMCGEVNEPSGTLGNKVHYCCRACGWWYSGINDCVELDEPTDKES